MADYRIDLEKAQHAPHHLYFIKLIWALNDLLSTQQLAHIAENQQIIPNITSNHLQFYLMRLHLAHLVEACKCFIYLVKPDKGRPLPEFLWIEKHNQLLKTFKEVRTLMDKPLYEGMRKCRDSVIFHYEHDDSSAIIEKAFNALSIDWKKFKAYGPCDLNRIIKTNDMVSDRFFIADHLMQLAWPTRMSLDIKDQKAQEDFFNFHKELLGTFMDYAINAILTWVRENQLLTSE